MRKNHIKNQKKIIALSLTGFVCASALLLGALELASITSLLGNKSIEYDDSSKTTSTEPTAQSDFTNGNDREAGSTQREDKGYATITDKEGEDVQYAPNSTASALNKIIVYSPTSNSDAVPPQQISGTSTLPVVHYRIIDDKTGVIATGQLKVINGKFSATMEFDTSANEGRIDVFATRSDGSEYENIEIPIKFK